jgi:hypothetical protein
MTTGQFVLQIVGITEGKILSWPSKKYNNVHGLSDIKILKDNRMIVAHTPSRDCDGLIATGLDILVAPCPPDEYDDAIIDAMHGDTFTHTIFLSIFRELNEHKNDPKPPPKPVKYKKTIDPPGGDTDDSEMSEEDDENEQFIAFNP